MQKDIERLKTLKNLMIAKKLDGLVFFHPENILLATGMLPGAAFTVSLFTANKVVIITPWWRAEAAASQSWADKVIAFNWLKNLKGVDPAEEIFKHLKILSQKLKIKRIGFDGDFGCLMPSYTPSSFFSCGALKTGLSDIFKTMVDVSGEIQKVRAVKTKYEIKKLKKTSIVAKEAAKAFYKNAMDGFREVDVAAEILKAVQSQAGKNGIRFTYCDPPQITSGVKRTFAANALSCPATNKKLKKGELAMLELGGCADGYWFDLTRTLVVGGKATQIHKDMANAVKAASAAAYNAYKDGQKTGSELTKAASKVLKKAGFENGIVHGIGHGLGFAYHEASPGIGPGSEDIIAPGTLTSMEPGIYLPRIGGIRIEENVLWKEKSVTILSDFHSNLETWQE